jgi:hypothetical protein
LSLPNSDIKQFLENYEIESKQIKDEIFRISWYMRGGVSSQDLFYLYSYEDRQIISEIIKENIEATKNTKMPLI